MTRFFITMSINSPHISIQSTRSYAMLWNTYFNWHSPKLFYWLAKQCQDKDSWLEANQSFRVNQPRTCWGWNNSHSLWEKDLVTLFTCSVIRLRRQVFNTPCKYSTHYRPTVFTVLNVLHTRKQIGWVCTANMVLTVEKHLDLFG